MYLQMLHDRSHPQACIRRKAAKVSAHTGRGSERDHEGIGCQRIHAGHDGATGLASALHGHTVCNIVATRPLHVLRSTTAIFCFLLFINIISYPTMGGNRILRRTVVSDYKSNLFTRKIHLAKQGMSYNPIFEMRLYSPVHIRQFANHEVDYVTALAVLYHTGTVLSFYYYYYYYYSTMALANKDDPISNGVVYCYEVSVDLGALNRSRWRRE